MMSHAHHSVTGRFDVDKKVELVGTITKVDWLNPHIKIFMDVTGEDGSVTEWMLSAAPPAFLRRVGITKKKLLGDGSQVTTRGALARDESLKHQWVYRITFEDGTIFQMSSPNRARST